MRITKDKARQLLKEFSLRATAPRIAVLRALASSADPLSHTEVLKHLGKTECDPATIYRSLVKLRDVGLATVVSRAEGIDRYAFTPKQNEGHSHPHFLCEDCGRVACLPTELAESISVKGPWARSIQNALVQFRGECPDCIDHSRKDR